MKTILKVENMMCEGCEKRIENAFDNKVKADHKKGEVEILENIDEFLENNQNSIDILEILWQNIVLEIPLKYTEVEDLSKYQGDGWKVIS